MPPLEADAQENAESVRVVVLEQVRIAHRRGAAAERAKIVAWLSDKLTMFETTLPGENTIYHATLAQMILAIERGEHETAP